MNSVDMHISAEKLAKNKVQQKLLQCLCQQITECALFIQAYSKDISFGIFVSGVLVYIRINLHSTGTRAIKNVFKDINGYIQEFKNKLTNIQAQFTAQTVMHIDLTVCYIADGFKDFGILFTFSKHFIVLIIYANLVASFDINKLCVVTDATGIDQSKGCLSGTREAFLEDLITWIYNPSESEEFSNIMILTGAAGTGKSSIAHTMAFWLAETKHLGCFFGFNHFTGNESWKFCFSTIAKTLSENNVFFKKALYESLQQNTALINSPDPAIQFYKWILNPIKAMELFGPFVIIIDALDESGDTNIQEKLLEILLHHASELPAYVKILITSRPEKIVINMIEAKKKSESLLVHKNLEQIDPRSTEKDITKFVHVYFQKKSHTDCAEILNKEDINWQEILVTKSGGLFQWASAACLFLTDKNKILQVSESWDQLKHNQDGVLFNLYASILNQQFISFDAKSFEKVQLILGCLISLQKPISLEALCQLLPDMTDNINKIIPKLGAMFSNVSNKNLPIKPLHTSCQDFFYKTETRFCISDIQEMAQYYIASGCFKVMNEKLKYNICNMDTSYVSTQKIPHLEKKISQYITESLQYAAINWANHLSAVKSDAEHKDALIDFVHKIMEHKLLFWFEVLSILDEMAKASIIIKQFKVWEKVM